MLMPEEEKKIKTLQEMDADELRALILAIREKAGGTRFESFESLKILVETIYDVRDTIDEHVTGKPRDR